MIENVKQLLNENILKINFTKIDGSDRTMTCTRDFSKIPKENHPKFGETTRTFNSSNIKVFDIEKEAWRTIRSDSIQTYSIIK